MGFIEGCRTASRDPPEILHVYDVAIRRKEYD